MFASTNPKRSVTAGDVGIARDPGHTRNPSYGWSSGSPTTIEVIAGFGDLPSRRLRQPLRRGLMHDPIYRRFVRVPVHQACSGQARMSRRIFRAPRTTPRVRRANPLRIAVVEHHGQDRRPAVGRPQFATAVEFPV